MLSGHNNNIVVGVEPRFPDTCTRVQTVVTGCGETNFFLSLSVFGYSVAMLSCS